MGTMSALSRTLCVTYKGCKWGYLDFDRKELKTREFPWQWHYGCHFVSFMMYISNAKFEELCSNTSRDISCSIFYHFSCTTDDLITVLICEIQKHQYL